MKTLLEAAPAEHLAPPKSYWCPECEEYRPMYRGLPKCAICQGKKIRVGMQSIRPGAVEAKAPGKLALSTRDEDLKFFSGPAMRAALKSGYAVAIAQSLRSFRIVKIDKIFCAKVRDFDGHDKIVAVVRLIDARWTVERTDVKNPAEYDLTDFIRPEAAK